MTVDEKYVEERDLIRYYSNICQDESRKKYKEIHR
jgi:hypothetical protein